MAENKGEKLFFHGLPVVELAEPVELSEENVFVMKNEADFVESVKSSHGGAYIFLFTTPAGSIYLSPAPGLGWFAFKKQTEEASIRYETRFE